MGIDTPELAPERFQKGVEDGAAGLPTDVAFINSSAYHAGYRHGARQCSWLVKRWRRILFFFESVMRSHIWWG
jgi:hypothetical protein